MFGWQYEQTHNMPYYSCGRRAATTLPKNVGDKRWGFAVHPKSRRVDCSVETLPAELEIHNSHL